MDICCPLPPFPTTHPRLLHTTKPFFLAPLFFFFLSTHIRASFFFLKKNNIILADIKREEKKKTCEEMGESKTRGVQYDLSPSFPPLSPPPPPSFVQILTQPPSFTRYQTVALVQNVGIDIHYSKSTRDKRGERERDRRGFTVSQCK